MKTKHLVKAIRDYAEIMRRRADEAHDYAIAEAFAGLANEIEEDKRVRRATEAQKG